MSPTQALILVTLRQIFQTFPELRVGQILVNALGEDPFYLSDEEVLARLEEYQHEAVRGL